MHRIPILLIAALLLACKQKSELSDSKHNAIRNDMARSITLELDSIHRQGHINGFAVAIVKPSQANYMAGFGYANMSIKKEYTTNTIQNIGSVSKTFIGIALLKAQEQGKLDLDDPVNKHLPFEVINPANPESPITIRHLATHTSTITDTEYYDTKAYLLAQNEDPKNYDLSKVGEHFNPRDESTSMPDFLESLLSKNGDWYDDDNFLDTAPGKLYEYSNVGATLAAYVLERAVKQSFNDYTTAHILNPLEMTSPVCPT